MGRYLIFFSYIGTHYRGLQVQRRGGEIAPDIKTVQGVLEQCLQKLKPANEVIIKTSSRTDCDVHAVCNTVHVDLVHKCPSEEFDPRYLSSKLNWLLIRKGEKIRVNNVLRVADNFNSRHRAVMRSYMFRLAVVKDVSVFSECNLEGFPLAATDCDSCVRVFPPFDVDLFRKAAEMISGYHNFLSFTTRASLRSERELKLEKIVPIRIRRSTPFVGDPRHTSELLDFWEIHFDCQSFLYKQVRRMVGAMVAMARGELSPEELQYMFDNPSLKNPGIIKAMPGQGLFLTSVHYPEEDLQFDPEKSSSLVPPDSSGEEDDLGGGDGDDISSRQTVRSFSSWMKSVTQFDAERMSDFPSSVDGESRNSETCAQALSSRETDADGGFSDSEVDPVSPRIPKGHAESMATRDSRTLRVKDWGFSDGWEGSHLENAQVKESKTSCEQNLNQHHEIHPADSGQHHLLDEVPQEMSSRNLKQYDESECDSEKVRLKSTSGRQNACTVM